MRLRFVGNLMLSVVVGGAVGFLTLAAALPALSAGRVLPRVTVLGVSLGGRTRAEAAAALAALQSRPEGRVRFTREGVLLREAPWSELGVVSDLDRTLDAALAVGRATGARGVVDRLRLLVRGSDLPVLWRIDEWILVSYLERAFGRLATPPREPSWNILEDGSFTFVPGEPGTALAAGELLAEVAARIAQHSDTPVEVPFVDRPPRDAGLEVRLVGVEVTRVAEQPLTLVADEVRVAVPAEARARWMRESTTAEDGTPVLELDRAALEQFLQSEVTPAVAHAPRDANFAVSEGRATAFDPPVPGRELHVRESAVGIFHGLRAGATTIHLVTEPVPPKVSVTPLMEQYGIRTLVGRGETDFAGSPKNRIHNIRVGSEKYHGLLVPPGAEFSFNENLGPVDAAHGFRRELVILSNVTTPQFGGGLCQVSTTMFRAAVHTGLPITARKNHAYAVSYYGTPGFDATIYPPNPDLRFVNDTPGHLLIRMHMEETKLAFEFWGASDGRQVEVRGPFPYARQPNGAVKAQLARAVRRSDGTVNEETWYSSYQSPKLFPKVLEANAERESWEERVRRIAEKDQRAQEEFGRRKAELERRQREAGSRQKNTTPRPSPTPEPAAQPE